MSVELTLWWCHDGSAVLKSVQKCFETHSERLVRPSKSLFGEHKITLPKLPNEDFGRIDKRGNPDFLRLTFRWFVAQIEYSRPWKVLRTSGFHLLFLLPKSSFRMDRIRAFCFAHHTDIGRRRGKHSSGIHVRSLFVVDGPMMLWRAKSRTFMLLKRRCWKDKQTMKSGC